MNSKVEHNKKPSRKERLLVWAAIFSMTAYILWRIFCTLPSPGTYGWLATFFGIVLLIAEIFSFSDGAEHFFSFGHEHIPDCPDIPLSWYPDIDVLIATHNEEISLLYKTVNGCKHLQYPDRKKVHIYLCDDGNRPSMAKLAEEMGVGYLPLADNKFAKAGNLNNALRKTNSPYVAILDADMIPTRNFLLETVPYMFLPRLKQLGDGTWAERSEDEIDPTYKIGFIQTPQSFYNPDLFQFNFFSEQRIPNEQDFFFREINVSRNRSNAPIFAGSNTLISRAALQDAGGIATGTITEDFETGINIQSNGYTCYALNKALVHGLAPTDIDSLIRQRIRWGRGCVSSLRRVHLLSNPNLSWKAKLSYLSCWSYWWSFFRRFIFIFSPIMFVAFRTPALICDFWELLVFWLPSYLLYNSALKITSGGIWNRHWSNIVDTAIFPYLILPILLESLLVHEQTFHVTRKTRSLNRTSDLSLAIPHLLLLAVDVLALFSALSQFILSSNFGSIVILYWLASNALSLIMATFFMSGRQNLRTNDRFFVRLPIELDYKGIKYYGSTNDLSETGMSITMPEACYIPQKQGSLALHLKTELYDTHLVGRATHVVQTDVGWKFGIVLDPPTGRDKDEYFQILYDRDHSLASVMGPSVGIYEDFFLNIHRRTTPNNSSRRSLPRITLNITCETTQGQTVRLLNCNFEFVLLEDPNDELDNALEILLPDGIMRCSRVPGGKSGLYQVDNWEELLFHDQFHPLFEQAKKHQTPQEPARV